MCSLRVRRKQFEQLRCEVPFCVKKHLNPKQRNALDSCRVALQQGAPTFMGLVASRVTTSMTALSVQPSLRACRLWAMDPAVLTSSDIPCTPKSAFQYVTEAACMIYVTAGQFANIETPQRLSLLENNDINLPYVIEAIHVFTILQKQC